MKEEFGQYLKQLRIENDLSIRQLATISDVSNAYISQIESGKRPIPSPKILKKISDPLNTSYEHLMLKAGYLDE